MVSIAQIAETERGGVQIVSEIGCKKGDVIFQPMGLSFEMRKLSDGRFAVLRKLEDLHAEVVSVGERGSALFDLYFERGTRCWECGGARAFCLCYLNAKPAKRPSFREDYVRRNRETVEREFDDMEFLPMSPAVAKFPAEVGANRWVVLNHHPKRNESRHVVDTSRALWTCDCVSWMATGCREGLECYHAVGLRRWLAESRSCLDAPHWEYADAPCPDFNDFPFGYEEVCCV